MSVNENDQPISTALDSATSGESKENRNQSRLLLEATSYLGRQGMALRDHDQSASSANRGSFNELVSTCSELCPILKVHVERR